MLERLSIKQLIWAVFIYLTRPYFIGFIGHLAWLLADIALAALIWHGYNLLSSLLVMAR